MAVDQPAAANIEAAVSNRCNMAGCNDDRVATLRLSARHQDRPAVRRRSKTIEQETQILKALSGQGRTTDGGFQPAPLAEQVLYELRLRFVTLLSRAADVADLPADPEFRAAIMGYAEWGSRLALENSQPGAEAVPEAPVPRWGWGVAPPYQP